MVRLCDGNTVGSGDRHVSMAGPRPARTSLSRAQPSIETNMSHHALQLHSTPNEPHCIHRSEVTVFGANHIRGKPSYVVLKHLQWNPHYDHSQASCVKPHGLIRHPFRSPCYLNLRDGDPVVRVLVQHPQDQRPQLFADLWPAQNAR